MPRHISAHHVISAPHTKHLKALEFFPASALLGLDSTGISAVKLHLPVGLAMAAPMHPETPPAVTFFLQSGGAT